MRRNLLISEFAFLLLVICAPDEAMGGDGGAAIEVVNSSTDDTPAESDSKPDRPLADFRLGPYPSALQIALDSIESGFSAYDTPSNYGHSAAQGYILQSVGSLLRTAHGWRIPGGEKRRDALVKGALDEIESLKSASHRVVGGGPAFGLEDAWDAFGDGSTNPAFTAYTWQSGMVALGVAEVLWYLGESGSRHADQAERAAAALVFLGELIDYWTPRYTEVELAASQVGGYFWYSDQTADAIAVHNTSALVAMASWIYGELTGKTIYQGRANACARLLRARMRNTPVGGYTWNYADDGYPQSRRRAEDISHAMITTQFQRFAAGHGLGGWNARDMSRVARTFSQQIWSDHPARLCGRVDGSRGGVREWAWTRAAVIGFAAHADASGGDPGLFDRARSILVSSYMTRYRRPLRGARVDAARTLALTRLIEHRPKDFRVDRTWTIVAGDDDDDAIPAKPGGVRFYTVDWGEPTGHSVGDLKLVARAASASNANILIDMEESSSRRVIVSITYAAAKNGQVQQWDGSAYNRLAAIPASKDETGTLRWMRTSFELRLDRFDYQSGVVGTNVLLQFAGVLTVHRIEATCLGE